MLHFLVQTIKTPEVIAVLLTTLIAVLERIILPATRVIWGTSHGFTFVVPQQGNPPGANLLVNKGTVFVQNIGRNC